MKTVEQLKAARAMLHMSQQRLCEKSGVGIATIKRIETGRGEISAYQRTIDTLRSTLESAGVVFIDANGGGPGVRLK